MKHLIIITWLGSLLTLNSYAQDYKCEGMGTVAGHSVKLSVVSDTQVAVDGEYADLDEEYTPRLNSGLLRFQYKNGYEGITEALLQDKLVDGASKGLLKIQSRGEVFSTDTYFCHP